MGEPDAYLVHPIGVVRSSLRTPADAPNQAFECAPEAVLEIDPAFADTLHRVQPGDAPTDRGRLEHRCQGRRSAPVADQLAGRRPRTSAGQRRA
jgi:hypothetical protein